MMKNKGITLIALVVTIVVLLIIAGISIVSVTGDNGIINQAGNAKDATEIGSEKEIVELSSIQSMELDYSGVVEKSNLEKFLNQNAGEGATKVRSGYNSYLVKFQESGRVYRVENNGIVKGPVFNENELTLGVEKPKNTDKYGYLVKNYKVPYQIRTTNTTSTNWRLFYQDEKYTYLITDELVGNYEARNSYLNDDKYSDGTQISIVGQKLSEKINSLFTDERTKAQHSIRATVWLTDTENGEWTQYINDDAVFCIGSPTIELFMASYNNNTNDTHEDFKKYKINCSLGTIGYNFSINLGDIRAEYLCMSDSYGIYNTDHLWWYLSSPANYEGARMLGSGRISKLP